MAKAVVLVLVLAGAAAPSASAEVPSGFEETTAFGGLVQPTVVRFAPDGRVFVAEKSGLIKVFDGLGDSTATVFADLRTQVHNYWDRGLLGMALDRDFDQFPYVYVTYTHDASIGGAAPRWGQPGVSSDSCPDPPGGNSDGCVVSGRLSRLIASGDSMLREEVLIEDWCQQYPSHSMGTVEQDSAGNLLVGGGDGASFSFTDYGQKGAPRNPCGDPPLGVGFPQTPPSAQGGALRSQDLRTRSDPGGLDGTVIRVNRNGNSVPGNPLHGDADADANEKRIVAHGLRNPFRFTLSPSGEVYLGDVGWGTWEEINRFSPGGGPFNFGWPCYEGNGRQPSYDAAGLKLCRDLYVSPGAVVPPFFTYNHNARVVAGESCPIGSSSISGLAFYDGSSFPAEYEDALFFADASRSCIWVMREGSNGRPDPTTVATFDAGAVTPVDLVIGPDGALYYAKLYGGAIQRIQYVGANHSPMAVATGEPTSGPAPLTVQFDGSGSSDTDPGDTLDFAWDLDGDGAYDDSTAVAPSHTYTQTGTRVASLRVTDDHGATGTASVTINVGNTPPVPTILSPLATKKWVVGEQISFAGSASDAEQGPLPSSALDWDLILHHCPSNCHQHAIQSFPDRASGSFPAPDHEYPSHLELRLTATDGGGLQASTTVRLDPRTVTITMTENQVSFALNLSLNGVVRPAPFTTTVIEGSTNSISAPSPQTVGGAKFEWKSWSHGGARTQTLKVSANRTFQATFKRIYF